MPIIRHLLAHSHPRLRHEALLTRLHLRPLGRNPVGYHHTRATNLQTKHNAAGHGPAPTRERPVARLFHWFSDSQTRRPWITQLCLTPLIYCLGDFSAQIIGDEDYDYHRSLRSFVIGLVIAIPSREWFLFLGRRFNYSSPSLSLGAKVAANQIFYTPMFNVYFFALHGLLAGEGLWGAIERVQNTVPTSIPRSILYWPLVTAFNFSYIRPQSRSIATSIFAVFWQSYLSWLNSSAGKGEAKHTCHKWISGVANVEDLDRQMLLFDDN